MILYFCLIILVGGFWLINLAITVLTSEYEKARLELDKEKHAEELGHSREHNLNMAGSFPVGDTKLVVDEDRMKELKSSGSGEDPRPSRVTSTPVMMSRQIPSLTSKVIVKREDVPDKTPPTPPDPKKRTLVPFDGIEGGPPAKGERVCVLRTQRRCY